MTPDQSPAGRRGTAASVLAIAIALLPNVTCPACWPAYAGSLSALGVPVLMGRAVLMPLTVLFMALAVGAMGFRANRRRGYGPFVLGLAAAVVIVVSKFVFATDGLAYTGIGLLVAASIWNTRPVRRSPMASCPMCDDPVALVPLEAGEKNGE